MNQPVPVVQPRSWKKTVAWLCGLLVALGLAGQALFDEDPATSPDLKGVVNAVTSSQ